MSEQTWAQERPARVKQSCFFFNCYQQTWASQVAQWVKNLPAMQEIRDTGLIPELGISPGGGRGNPLQCSCLESSMDRGAWKAAVYRIAESDMTEVN